MQANTWTDERVDELKSLWEEGLSASQIGARLGGVTRNTIIGKLDRLGLLGKRPARDTIVPVPGPTPGESVAARPCAAQRPPRPIPSPPDTLEIQARLVETGKDAPAEVAAPAAIPPHPAPSDAPNGLVGIQALSTGTCRWPVGDPQKDGFGFCGAKALTSRPYCEAHAKLAYEPPRERRRAS